MMESCGRLAAKYFSSVTCIGKLLMSSLDRFFSLGCMVPSANHIPNPRSL